PPSNKYGRNRQPARLNKLLARGQASSMASSMTSSASQITANDPTLLGGVELADETATEKVHSFTVTDRIRAHLSRDLAATRDRKIAALFVSHGECMEEAFPAWLRLAYLGGGSGYRSYDLNMPLTIPKRPHSHYEGDSPLTEHGKVTSELLGHGMRLEKLHPVRIYSSPDLRCVQTATAIARSLRSSSATICIEPALMEWTKLRDKDAKRLYFTPKQYRYLNYPIDFGYAPEASIKEIVERGESPREYHDRLTGFIAGTFKASKDSVVLFVGSAQVVHAARDETWQTPADILSISASTDPCSIHMIEIGKGGEILMNDTPLRHLTPTLFDSLQFAPPPEEKLAPMQRE
ncbi:hypothetical protein PENTCL1PPCAC_12189, partial [Pristionchus entomophagus]